LSKEGETAFRFQVTKGRQRERGKAGGIKWRPPFGPAFGEFMRKTKRKGSRKHKVGNEGE